MSFIGDLERLLAELWPLRVPVAVGLTIGLLALALLAWRRGWYRIALGHPRISIAVIIAIFLVGSPITWVLGSPLFIRTTVVDTAPVSAPSSRAVVLQGEVMGADDFHTGSGVAKVIETTPGKYVLRFEEFSVRNGPDLFVYVSPDPTGWTPEAVNLGTLVATDGAFNYDIPQDIGLEDIGSAVIWCRAFSVLFASASLESPSDDSATTAG